MMITLDLMLKPVTLSVSKQNAATDISVIDTRGPGWGWVAKNHLSKSL